jgi:hypothetical protein
VIDMAKGLRIGALAVSLILVFGILWSPRPSADTTWVAGDLQKVATALNVQPNSDGKYDLSEILCAMLEVMGVDQGCSSPCEECLARINRATKADFMAIYGIGDVKAADLVAAQPFLVASCSVYSIESALDAVPGIGEVLRQRIVQHFCPELYGE